MDLKQVKQDILSWSETFLEAPNAELGGWAPCPYARRARLANQVDIRIGKDPYHDLEYLCGQGLGTYQVVIYAYDPAEWTQDYFTPRLVSANRDFLLAADLIALEDHPDDPEIVNGVCMNQGIYALAMCQALNDLDLKAQLIAAKGFYNTWPEKYLTQLFQHRRDPRA
jgi:hypothetical protein